MRLMSVRHASFVGLILLAGCGSPRASAHRQSVEVGPTSSSDAAAPSAEPTATASTPAPTSATLFDYGEEGDFFAFLPPATVLLRRATHGPPPCKSELSEGGNMYSGRDVHLAFAHPDIAAALANDRTYRGPKSATLRAPGHPGSITWTTSCPTCAESPPGVAHLREALEVVMLNRKLVCG